MARMCTAFIAVLGFIVIAVCFSQSITEASRNVMTGVSDELPEYGYPADYAYLRSYYQKRGLRQMRMGKRAYQPPSGMEPPPY
ncbi:unnamed protein product [Calicophoron daubneyi]|uniref:Uncharacterized protein n=1 Tax=Calicophoron daubneyi TaxID=300641 RepID=A0AAV2TRT9_CALDB